MAYNPGLPLGIAASSRCNSAADCQRRPGSSSRHRLTMVSSLRARMRLPLDGGSLARQHFVEDPAECVDIGAGIRGSAFPLLRRHVGRRAHHHSFAGECLVSFQRSPARNPGPSTPDLVSIMLPGFRSRWMMPFSCAASSAAAI